MMKSVKSLLDKIET